MSILETPRYMPAGEPRVLLDQKPLEYRKVHPCGHNSENNDGTIYYYDEPLLFLAFLDGQLVIVTLIDSGYANDGVENNQVIGARGWDQHLAITIGDDLLADILASRKPLRDYAEQPDAKAWFIHTDWVNLGESTGLDRFDSRNWYSVYRVFETSEILDTWKSTAGITLNGDA